MTSLDDATRSTGVAWTPPAELPAGPVPPTADAPGAGRSRWRSTDTRIVSVLVVLLVVTQRIGVPVGDTSISIALPLGYLLIGLMVVRGSLTVSPTRLELLLLALAGVITASVLVGATGGSGLEYSMASLGLLVAIYLPWVLHARGADVLALARHAGLTFVRTMLVLATVGIAQVAAQLAGVWAWTDYLGLWLPRDFIVPLYNYDNALAFGSPIYKGTAFVLLEPSFLSQLCALAVIIGLLLRIRPWQLVLLIAGMGAAVSGTGIFLLAAAAVLLLLQAPRLVRPAYAVAGALAVALVLWSPIADTLLSRSGELTQTESSGYARFVAPYKQVLAGLNDEPLRWLIGAGPGTSESLLVTNREGVGTIVLYSTVPKLAFEYGLLAGGLFVVFLLVAMLRGMPWKVVPGSLLFMTVFLSGALLQPQTAFLAWIFTILVARDALRPAGPRSEIPPAAVGATPP